MNGKDKYSNLIKNLFKNSFEIDLYGSYYGYLLLHMELFYGKQLHMING